jgi:hypothetical protein
MGNKELSLGQMEELPFFLHCKGFKPSLKSLYFTVKYSDVCSVLEKITEIVLCTLQFNQYLTISEVP